MTRTRKTHRSSDNTVIETMGRLAVCWGLRRNLGRAWAVLYLSGEPLPASDICKKLKLSTGSVSMTLTELHRWGFIRQVLQAGERRKLYTAEVDVWRVISRILRARELVTLNTAVDHLEEALADLKKTQGKIERGSKRRTSTENR